MELNDKTIRRKRIEYKRKKEFKTLEQSTKKHETYNRRKDRFDYKEYLSREESV